MTFVIVVQKTYFSNSQRGFISVRTTASNLVCITQYISENMDDAGQVDIIYTDFSKEFDRVDRGILL